MNYVDYNDVCNYKHFGSMDIGQFVIALNLPTQWRSRRVGL